ncbi:putative TM2 domain-containing protein 3-like [Apostichopus japonicus]|uniref:Putative TM2 domain-containing protein 3-like n=1 Tax=Stichopus japonicus TaxID=307972 RepID=A0A2G8KDX4_STIJA|nr:putative TM2 domain-containing protein 3-like [Apostichopus japonicus]
MLSQVPSNVLFYTGTTTVAQQDVPTLATMTDDITTQHQVKQPLLHQTVTTKTSTVTSQTDSPDYTDSFSTEYPQQYDFCPSQLPCNQLSGDCLDCNMTSACIYGRQYNITCIPKSGLDCTGPQEVQRTYKCKYCYQTEPWEQICTPANNCTVNSCPKTMVQVNCSVLDDVLCLGNRRFYKKKECNWTSGYKWSTAFILSITLGGFGVDRFYLGYWESGLGKLFSFGGIGIWTLIDILLIAVGYIPPGDGSVYV